MEENARLEKARLKAEKAKDRKQQKTLSSLRDCRIHNCIEVLMEANKKSSSGEGERDFFMDYFTKSLEDCIKKDGREVLRLQNKD